MLFIDARKIGHMVDRTRREFSDEDIAKIARSYHAWRGEPEADVYEDVPGFCKEATLEEIEENSGALTPGRFVGIETHQVDVEPFEEKIQRLATQLIEQQAEGARLDTSIARNLKSLGFWKVKDHDQR